MCMFKLDFKQAKPTEESLRGNSIKLRGWDCMRGARRLYLPAPETPTTD